MIRIDIKKFSNRFDIRKLTLNDVEEIYSLCKENTFYYEHCKPFVTRESIQRDMKMFPKNKTLDDKYYIGFFNDQKLIAVMDFINAFPYHDYGFIGFFMIDRSMQNKGLGSSMIKELFHYLKNIGFKGIRLAFIESNDKARNFWLENGFKETEYKIVTELYTAIVAEKML